jgi:hypothetical protein
MDSRGGFFILTKPDRLTFVAKRSITVFVIDQSAW